MIETRLRELAIAFPDEPDLTTAVVARISRRRQQRRPALRAAVALASLILVVLAIPAVRSQVAAWLGIESLVIVTTDDLDLAVADRVDVGALTVSLEQASSIAGFEPARSPDLPPPDRVRAAESIVWMFHAATDRLPETDLDGVGAIVTQWSATSGITDVKSFLAGTTDDVVVTVNGEPAFWFAADHVVEIRGPDGTVIERRAAGSTLIWLDGERVLRLESALDRDAAVDLASSFTVNR